MTTQYEKEYLRVQSNILNNGRWKASRPGLRTLSSDEEQMVIDLRDNKIALLSSKQVLFETFFHENIWFISGSSNVAYLKKNGISIWDDWVIPSTAVFQQCENPTGQDMLTYLRCKVPAHYKLWKNYKADHKIGRPTRDNVKAFITETTPTGFPTFPQFKLVSGEIGNGAYGPMWRRWPELRAVTPVEARDKRGYLNEVGAVGLYHDKAPNKLVGRHIDQFADAIKALRETPDSRRIIVSAWNPALLEETVLPPCHTLLQFLSYDNGPGKKRSLTLKLLMRSSDGPVGLPFNAGQYSVLAHMVAHITNHVAEKLVITLNDAHIYEDQIELMKEQLARPTLDIDPKIEFVGDIKELNDFKFENLRVTGYDEGDYLPNISYPVAV